MKENIMNLVRLCGKPFCVRCAFNALIKLSESLELRADVLRQHQGDAPLSAPLADRVAYHLVASAMVVAKGQGWTKEEWNNIANSVWHGPIYKNYVEEEPEPGQDGRKPHLH